MSSDHLKCPDHDKMGKNNVALDCRGLNPVLMAPQCDNRIGQNKYHTNNFALCTPSKKGEESSILKTHAIFLFLVF